MANSRRRHETPFQKRRQQRTKRMVDGLKWQTHIQCNLSRWVGLDRLVDTLNDDHEAPHAAKKVAHAIRTRFMKRRNRPITFVGTLRICELEKISPTTARAGRDYLVAEGYTNFHPPNGLQTVSSPKCPEGKPMPVGGAGWAGGFSAGPRLGGPDLHGVEIPPDHGTPEELAQLEEQKRLNAKMMAAARAELERQELERKRGIARRQLEEGPRGRRGFQEGEVEALTEELIRLGVLSRPPPSS